MSARDRTPFETFWIAKGAPAGSLREIEAHARERRRDLRDEFGFSQSGFLPADAPIGAKLIFNQKRNLDRLAEIATAEGSAIPTGSWPDFVSIRDNLGTAQENLLEAGGRFPVEERERARIGEDEVDELARQNAIEFIVDACESIDAAGADGAGVLEAIVQGEQPPSVEGVDVDGIADDLLDIEDEFGTPLVVDAIAECRDRLAGPELEIGEEVDIAEVLDRLQERFDLPRALSFEEALAALEERVEAAPADEAAEEEAALNRLSRAFGRPFDSIQDAIRDIQERLAEARGQRLDITPIEARRTQGGELRLEVESTDPDVLQFRGAARQRIERELDLSNLGPTFTEVGEIRLRGGDLVGIDLTIGREKLGAVAEPQPLDIELGEAAGEQVGLEEATASELVDEFIEIGQQ